MPTSNSEARKRHEAGERLTLPDFANVASSVTFDALPTVPERMPAPTPDVAEAARLIRTVLAADAELGCGTVLVESDAIDPHALLWDALGALGAQGDRP